MKCKKCNEHNAGGTSIVSGLCSFCFEKLEEDAKARGFSLRRAPQRFEADERQLWGVKIFYWRNQWRVA